MRAFEVFDGSGPVVFQEAGEGSVGQEAAFGLAGGAVVGCFF